MPIATRSRSLLAASAFLLSLSSPIQTIAQSLLPLPRSVEWDSGYFCLSSPVSVEIDSAMAKAAEQARFRALWPGTTSQAEQAGKRRLLVRQEEGAEREAYTLRLTPDTVEVRACSADGIRHAFNTLCQLRQGDSLRCCTIGDGPVFAWRGLMLDVSRHFFPMSHLKRQIDLMAAYKLNRLHLHLTDGAGWRMEIKRYPELTRIAAWRTDSLWTDWWRGQRRYAHEGDASAYGGYYTQQQLRELVNYAAERGITIVPEVEMPGHSEEVLAVYPALSCTHVPYEQADFCPGNEATFRFIEDVLDEVMDVFPSEDIHIGGDEAAKKSWGSCPLCQQRMAREGLADVQQLQAYFVRRVSAYLERHGRRMVGWDEVIADSLGTGATVMLWRDTALVHDAIDCGYEVVLSPGLFCYLDSYQDDPPSQPEAIGGFRPLAHVYSYEPLAQLTASERAHIRGLQANLWAEYIPTPAHAEYMLYPRLLAVAELAWHGAPADTYQAFHSRALQQVEQLRAAGVNAFDLAGEVGDRQQSRTRHNHKARGASVAYNYPYHEAYPAAGDSALTDGYMGGWDYGKPSAWQGFIKKKRFDVVIDLGRVQPITSVQTNFYQAAGVEIYYPARFVVSVSTDGEKFKKIKKVRLRVQPSVIPSVSTMGWSGSPVQARYVRVQAEPCELGGWIFVDEIVVD